MISIRRRAVVTGGCAAFALASQRPSAETMALRLGGTGMALAAMRRVAAAFAAATPGMAAVVLPSLGTSGGLAAARAGALDLALLARPLADGERAEGFDELPYARTPLAFVTSGGGTTAGVTLAEVAAILRGEITTWPDGSRLRLVRRDRSDADWQLLRRISPEMESAIDAAWQRPGVLTVGTDQENAEALGALRGSFGAMAIGQLRAEGLRLRPLLLDGVAPEVAPMRAHRYPLSRTLHVAWHGEPASAPASFLAFLQGEVAGAILLGLGHDRPGQSS